MRKIRQIMAIIGLILIIGLTLATVILGIMGSQLCAPMLVVTSAVVVLIWGMLMLTRLVQNKDDNER